MSHDPLCVCSRRDHAHFYYTIPDDQCMACKCDDIAQVRADEREQAAQRVEALSSSLYKEKVQGLTYVTKAAAAARGEA